MAAGTPWNLMPAHLSCVQAWLRDVHQLQLPGGGMQIADCFDLEDARRSYFGQLFPLSERGGRQGCNGLGVVRQRDALPGIMPGRDPLCRTARCPRTCISLLPPVAADPGGIVPSGPTAADLGLHLPPGRGPVAFQAVFHLRAAGSS